jgi:hypothetical protein
VTYLRRVKRDREREREISSCATFSGAILPLWKAACDIFVDDMKVGERGKERIEIGV